MAISPTDIKFYRSGGGSFAGPGAGLGGGMSTSQLTSGLVRDFFDDVQGSEARAGSVEYRCFYVVNTHATLSLTNTAFFIQSLTSSPDDELDIALDPAAVGSDSTLTIANETTSPGLTFTRPQTYATGLGIGTMAAGQQKALWVRRTVNAAAGPVSLDTSVLRVQGETPP